ncbi:MAG: DUF427 domain-containing protein [Bacteroidota bacterium]
MSALAEESVWDYPRPPRLEPVEAVLAVDYAGQRLAETTAATGPGLRVLETSHPPTYYLPPASIAPGTLVPVNGRSFCEFKGMAQYFDVVLAGRTARRAAWCYPAPTAGFAALTGYIALYASAMEACWVGETRVLAQEGDFYGGWITPNLRGPFKGAPGTRHW